MTDEKLDLLLRQALNLEIADHDIQIDAAKIKSDRNTTSWKYWKHFPAAAASVAVLTLSSMMVCAAWHYLSAKDVAGKAADPHLAQEFEQNNWIDGCETQIYGDYNITLLGIVSGNEISSHLSKDDSGNIDGDKTYVAVAISHSDCSPMPDPLNAGADSVQFYVSPYIKGLDPAKYNISVLGVNNTVFLSDGIQYQLLGMDTIAAFAGQDIYLGVSEGSNYNPNAYLYDSASGTLTRNESFNGVNALFTLPVDPTMGDSEKATNLIDAMDHYESGGESTIILSEADRWLNSITPETIGENAVPLESSRKTVSTDEFFQYTGNDVSNDSNTGSLILKEYFPDGTGMSEWMTRSGTSMEDAFVETYTLNKDGTITILRYLPNLNK